MEAELRLRIVLAAPPCGVDFGLQSGKGSKYQTVQTQRSEGKDLSFDCTVTVKENREDGLPNFLGPSYKGRRTVASSTSTLEHLPDSVTRAGSAGSKFR
jgi:hypothetical protein